VEPIEALEGSLKRKPLSRADKLLQRLKREIKTAYTYCSLRFEDGIDAHDQALLERIRRKRVIIEKVRPDWSEEDKLRAFFSFGSVWSDAPYFVPPECKDAESMLAYQAAVDKEVKKIFRRPKKAK